MDIRVLRGALGCWRAMVTGFAVGEVCKSDAAQFGSNRELR